MSHDVTHIDPCAKGGPFKFQDCPIQSLYTIRLIETRLTETIIKSSCTSWNHANQADIFGAFVSLLSSLPVPAGLRVIRIRLSISDFLYLQYLSRQIWHISQSHHGQTPDRPTHVLLITSHLSASSSSSCTDRLSASSDPSSISTSAFHSTANGTGFSRPSEGVT